MTNSQLNPIGSLQCHRIYAILDNKLHLTLPRFTQQQLHRYPSLPNTTHLAPPSSTTKRASARNISVYDCQNLAWIMYQRTTISAKRQPSRIAPEADRDRSHHVHPVKKATVQKTSTNSLSRLLQMMANADSTDLPVNPLFTGIVGTPMITPCHIAQIHPLPSTMATHAHTLARTE